MAMARQLRAAGVPLREIPAAVREAGAALRPIAEAAQAHLDAQPEPLWDTEVMPQSTPLWGVNNAGVLGFVVGWRWSRPPKYSGRESIPRVQLDPVVVWEGQGMALDHNRVGEHASEVAVYDRRDVAQRAAADLRAKRT